MRSRFFTRARFFILFYIEAVAARYFSGISAVCQLFVSVFARQPREPVRCNIG
jgi:hypothetical protein